MSHKQQDFAKVAAETAGANLAYGGANTALAVYTGSPGQLADAVHSVLDAVAHLLHGNTHTSKKRAKLYQALAGTAIAGGALFTGYHSIEAVINPEASFKPLALVAELGAVGLNGYYWSKSANSPGNSRGRAHGIWHNTTDTALSMVAATGIALDEFTNGISDGAAGIGISAVALVLAYKVATDKKHGTHNYVPESTLGTEAT